MEDSRNYTTQLPFQHNFLFQLSSKFTRRGGICISMLDHKFKAMWCSSSQPKNVKSGKSNLKIIINIFSINFELHSCILPYF